MILAFEYMHNKSIIYRDLKPENLLLDSTGYLKITDFGFAKVVKDRTWTLCGTPDYLAPEVVSGQGHNKGVDWWTLGILIYEMLASYPPFYDDDPMKTYAKIMHGQLSFPMHFSKPAVDLIRRLLHHKATKRIGVLKGGAKLIIDHAWCGGDTRVIDTRALAVHHTPDIAIVTDKYTKPARSLSGVGRRVRMTGSRASTGRASCTRKCRHPSSRRCRDGHIRAHVTPRHTSTHTHTHTLKE